jgi:pimeloyl-ACP methyl ester carboxylesterase
MPGDPVAPETGRQQSAPLWVETPEGRVAWHEAGEGEAAPLVLLHGFTGHRDDFIGVLPALAKVRRSFAPDLRGHGDSDSRAGTLGWSFDQLVNDLSAYLEALSLDRVHLLGHSVGGFVALRLALAQPERVRSLVLVCSAPETPGLMDPGGWRAGTGISAERGMEGLQPLVERSIRADSFEGLEAWADAERYFSHHRRRYRAMTAESYRGIGTAFFESDSLVARLPEVAMPALVLVGERDREWLPGADLFEQNLPEVRRLTIPGAEHHPHQENRQAFLAAVQDHLARVDGASAANEIQTHTRRTR